MLLVVCCCVLFVRCLLLAVGCCLLCVVCFVVCNCSLLVVCWLRVPCALWVVCCLGRGVICRLAGFVVVSCLVCFVVVLFLVVRLRFDALFVVRCCMICDVRCFCLLCLDCSVLFLA